MTKKRISVGVPAEDLVIGDFVAIVEPPKKKERRVVLGRDEDGDPSFRMIIDKDSCSECTPGIPHQVLGISWPWAVFGVLIPGGDVEGPVIHDLRKVKCLRLQKEFVNAIKAFEKPEKEVTETETPF